MSEAEPHVWAVIMAGGSGTRFWPVSRAEYPKQLTRIVGDDTMIQATVARLQPAIAPERILVITTTAIVEQTRAQLPMLKPEHVIAEPVGRDTAACVCLAAEVVAKLDPEGVCILLPADQVISPATRFQETLMAGVAVAQEGDLVTYGITPRSPATGYGYIRIGDDERCVSGMTVNKVDRFVEKPDRETAERYLSEGGYRWNSGIFTWRADVVLDEFGRHCPWLREALDPVGAAFGGDGVVEALERAYDGLDKISVDYALMERASSVRVVTCDFEWDDVGSWDALYDHLAADDDGVRLRGNALIRDCGDCLVVDEGGPFLAAIGLQGVSIISTPDAVLVVAKGASQGVKQVVETLKEQRPGLL